MSALTDERLRELIDNLDDVADEMQESGEVVDSDYGDLRAALLELIMRRQLAAQRKQFWSMKVINNENGKGNGAGNTPQG